VLSERISSVIEEIEEKILKKYLVENLYLLYLISGHSLNRGYGKQGTKTSSILSRCEKRSHKYVASLFQL